MRRGLARAPREAPSAPCRRRVHSQSSWAAVVMLVSPSPHAGGRVRPVSRLDETGAPYASRESQTDVDAAHILRLVVRISPLYTAYLLRIYRALRRPAWVPLSKENGLGPTFLAAARGPAPDAALSESGRGPTRKGRPLSESASRLGAACCVLRVLGWQTTGSGSRRAELSMAYMPH